MSIDPDHAAPLMDDRIVGLARQLSKAKAAIDALLNNEADALIDPFSGEPILLGRAWTGLRESEAYLRLLLDRVPSVVWATDRELVCTSALGSALALMDPCPGQALESSLAPAAHGSLSGWQIVAAHRRALMGECITLEIEHQEHTYQVWIEPLCDHEGDVTGVLGLVLDVSERKQVEKALLAQRDELLAQQRELTATRDDLEGRVRRQMADLMAANEELQVQQEELMAQQEELRRQNEELIAAQQALEAERRRYQDLFDLAPDGYVVTDLQGIIREANQAAGKLLDVSSEALLGTPLAAYQAGTSQAAFQEHLRCLREGEVSEVRDWDTQIALHGGATLDVSISATPAWSPSGEMVGQRWLVRDISERIRLRDRLRFQADALDQVGDAVIAVDRQGRITYLNRSAAERYGADPQADVGRQLDELYVDEWLAPGDRAAMHTALGTDGYWRGRSVHVQREGRRTWVESTVSVLEDKAGRPVGRVAAIRDISAQVQWEREREYLLQENRSQRVLLEQLMAVAPVGIAVVRAEDHRYQYVNPYYQSIPGVPDIQMVGRTIEEVFPSLVARGVIGIVDEARRTGKIQSLREYEASVGPGREQTYWNVDHVPLPGADGEADLVLILAAEVTEQVRVRQRVESLARFPDENPDPVLRVDQEGQILYANRASQEVLAFWDCQVGRFLPEKWRSVVADVFGSGSSREIEVPHQDRIWVLTLTPIAPVGYVNVYGHDITERKQAEQQLHLYTERLRVLYQMGEAILGARSAAETAAVVLSQAPRLLPCQRASVVLVDLQARKLSLLASHATSTLQAIQEWQGPIDKHWLPVVQRLAAGHEYIVDDLQMVAPSSPIMAQLQGEGVRAVVREPLIVQGKLIGMLDLALSVPGPLPPGQMEVAREMASQLAVGIQQALLYEQVQRYAGELEQRVQQRTAELAARTTELQVSEARFRAVFEQAAIGIALVNRQGGLISSNPALQRLLGYAPEEMNGLPLRALVHPEEEDPLRVLVKGKQSYYRAEQRYRRKNGETIDANVTASFVRPGRGKVHFAIVLVEDISERKRAQAALLHSERLALTGRLAASIAHEVNNPLQSVIGCLALVDEIQAEGGDAGSFIHVAMDELERAARIVHQMRDMNRPSLGHKEPVDINPLVEKVLLLSKKQCQNRRVEVTWEAGENLPPLPGVPDRIQQIFLNLALNAVDAMPGGGRLHIRTALTQDPRGVTISFADTGVGIPEEQLGHLFEAFRSTKEEGLGLGLYVSRNIAQEHGGRIEVQSQVGQGTTFTVWLPVG